MIFSHTQVSNYIGCPRRYRFRYFDGWEELANRASLVFGRVFEQALANHFQGKCATESFLQLWAQYRDGDLEYGFGDCWEKLAEEGRQLLERFVSDSRVEVSSPEDLQVKYQRRIGPRDEFVAYLDAVGQLDGVRCIIDWKTSGASYPNSPTGLVALDQQLVAYSWATRIPEVALVVFVRKKKPEIQYLRATVSEAQRLDYGRTVDAAVAAIRQARFEPRPGIRFPNNNCLSCSYIGLCLGRQELVVDRLQRKADTVWLDEIAA
jgi:hypothetical protein